jgi:ribosomal protein L34
LVLLGRWKTGVCPSCFDELAEQAGIRYSFEDVSAVSWSDMPLPKTTRRGNPTGYRPRLPPPQGRQLLVRRRAGAR